MNLRKTLISGVAALTLGVTGATAANNTSTKLATDGTGDYLVFPYYAAVQMANGTWKTNLRVVNTNTHDAIVAKVVFREMVNSKEKLDFLIYLSPGDVWEGVVKLGQNGEVVVESNDDSMVIGGVPASAQAPITQALFVDDKNSENQFGYVEVIGLGQIPASSIDAQWAVNTPLDKSKIYKKYKQTLQGQSLAAAKAAGWTGVDCDSLYAEEILLREGGTDKLAMTLPAVALEGVTGTDPNNNYQIAQATRVTNFTMPDTGSYDAVVTNIETALAKSHVYATYYGENGNVAETALLLTQPMKKYRLELSKMPGGFDDLTDRGYVGSGLKSSDYSFRYSAIARDMQEHPNIHTTEFSGGTQKIDSCNTEICVFTLDDKYTGTFDNGYVDFALGKGWNVSGYSGIPTIATLMTAKKVDGVDITNIMYAPAQQ